MILAGPFADKSGSLIVFATEPLEVAKAYAAEDPYVKESVFESHEVRPFKQIFPK